MLRQILDVYKDMYIILKGDIKTIKNVIEDYRYIRRMRRERYKRLKKF